MYNLIKTLVITTLLSCTIATQNKALAQVEIDATLGSTIIADKDITNVYEVENNGAIYEFVVDVIAINEDGSRVFNYYLTNEKGTNGTVTITKDAMQNAVNQYNFFSGGPITLTDMTTVWISQKVLNELLNDEQSTISSNGGMNQTTLEDVEVGYDFYLYNGFSGDAIMDLIYIKAADAGNKVQYWIHPNPYNPIILHIDMGWTITLKEMRPSER